MQPEFKPWGKTPRWSGLHVIVTEKLDGTNALVYVSSEGEVMAGSRNRWLTPGKTSDNYGFAGWCEENKDELVKLGPGYHYGEWWGKGIGRGYGLEDRRFSLFNSRNPDPAQCLSLCPVLHDGQFDDEVINDLVLGLRGGGSVAAPGYMSPEGLCLYFPQMDFRAKIVLDKRGPSTLE